MEGRYGVKKEGRMEGMKRNEIKDDGERYGGERESYKEERI